MLACAQDTWNQQQTKQAQKKQGNTAKIANNMCTNFSSNVIIGKHVYAGQLRTAGTRDIKNETEVELA